MSCGDLSLLRNLRSSRARRVCLGGAARRLYPLPRGATGAGRAPHRAGGRRWAGGRDCTMDTWVAPSDRGPRRSNAADLTIASAGAW